MKTFSDDVRERIYEAQNGICALCTNPIHSFHHIVPNTKVNNSLYPHFLHTPFNCVGLCFHDHQHRKHEIRISYKLAEYYEEYLCGISCNA